MNTDEALEAAWHERWHVALDMNHDGAFTLMDVWAWFDWLYYAPGDFAILLTLREMPSVAKFLEIDASMVSGRLSWWFSTVLYVLVLIGLISEKR